MWTRLLPKTYRSGVRRFFSDFLKITDEVSTALGENRGVVALESTVITHGMPYPDNVNTAKDLESIIRREGCVPATIAVADGKIHVGTNDDLLDRLASTKDAIKVSRRDLATALSRRSFGGTTVSATMIASHLAGISVFATGGIGGVHRGVEETLDISADLTELGRTPVAVVCAGVKSILDAPKTLEFLETQGVPVIAYSSDDNWPGFFTASSGSKAPYNSREEKEIATVIDSARQLDLQHGFVIGVPIPEEESELGLQLESAIQSAVEEARMQSVRGRDVTPFVLNRLNQLTGGLSLRINIALIKNNAMVAAKIAKALSDLRLKNSVSGSGRSGDRPAVTSGRSMGVDKRHETCSISEVVVIGGTIVDFYIGTSESLQADGGTRSGTIAQSCGGVGRNHADALTRLGLKTLFISAVGKDQHAQFVRSCTPHLNFRGVRALDNIPTATYAGVTNDGNLSYGIGCMRAHDYVTTDWVRLWEKEVTESKMVVLDGNVPEDTIRYVCDMAYASRVQIWFDPTDSRKAAKICRVGGFSKLSYVSPNFNEFLALIKALRIPLDVALITKLSMPDLSSYLLENAKWLFDSSDRLDAFVVTMGSKGLLILHKTEGSYQLLHYAPPISPDVVVNVSGAGDCLNAGIIRGLLSPIRSFTNSVDIGLACARSSLLSKDPVPKELDEIGRHMQGVQHVSPVLTSLQKS